MASTLTTNGSTVDSTGPASKQNNNCHIALDMEPVQTRSKRKGTPINNENVKRPATSERTNNAGPSADQAANQHPMPKKATAQPRAENKAKLRLDVFAVKKIQNRTPATALLRAKSRAKIVFGEHPYSNHAQISVLLPAMQRQAATEAQGYIKQTLGTAIAAALTPVLPLQPVPLDVVDFDRKNCNDPCQVSHYAMDIFNYLKTREQQFHIEDYMHKQIHMNTFMRSQLVDWMVEVLGILELEQETLYLAVKIVDRYLCREVIVEEKLQLLAATAFFIACKYDEFQLPCIEVFLDFCDEDYTRNELIQMERDTLRIINYQLGMPLSYRFLHRYARCADVPIATLTLARYILELSLMDYATIGFSDSQMASAVLYMALRMDAGIAKLEQQAWTATLVHYTGYQLSDFAKIVPILNAGLHRRPQAKISVIRKKYSEKKLFEVVNVPLLTSQQLFQHNLDLKLNPIGLS
ncbi:G2/mitotic-specific cyclin-B3-like [Drosophila obscura]|uniref:G2/mitotic-specific cyclin-B3-like n=1 Tax=Drosophila obscura TaxID=7282 RepID=UPI000B9FDADB|nr:G2/mitotic-specific cyclin-B3-like [Drosophila obscura]